MKNNPKWVSIIITGFFILSFLGGAALPLSTFPNQGKHVQAAAGHSTLPNELMLTPQVGSNNFLKHGLAADEPPTAEPNQQPAIAATPTTEPTSTPTAEPSQQPAIEATPTTKPISTPTAEPSQQPAIEATPTTEPTSTPTAEPTATSEPTSEPTNEPSPTPGITNTPEATSTAESTNTPTIEPTQTVEPTGTPTAEPSPTPTETPVPLSLTLIRPFRDIVASQGELITIEWTYNDPTETGKIKLALGKDNQRGNGVGINWIAENLNEEPSFYNLDTTKITPGVYYIWGIIYKKDSSWSYSNNSITQIEVIKQPNTSSSSTRINAPEAISGFQRPMSNDHYGYKWLDWTGTVYHPGDDYNGPGSGDSDCGTDILAVGNGIVRYVDTSGWGGIVIEHNWKGTIVYSHYGHISQSLVAVDQIVSKGDHIAEMGKVGANSCHLHWEIRKSNHPNPTDGNYYIISILSIKTNVENYYYDPEWWVVNHGPYEINHSPSTPTNINPTSGSFTSTPQLSWNASTDPDGDAITYQVNVWGSANYQSSWFSGTSITPTGLGVGNYSWNVTARDEHGAEAVSSDGGFSIISNPVTLTATLSADKLTISVYWSGVNPSGTDWISMHLASAPDSQYITWLYANGSSGTVTFNSPTAPGNYDFRYFRYSEKIATSNIITIAAIPKPSTTTINNITPNQSYVNQIYTVAVTVSGGYGTPTGSVDINDGSGGTCAMDLTNGSSSCDLASNSTGSKIITATYNGDGTYTSSTNNTTHNVVKATSNTSISSDNPDPSYVNQSYLVAVTVSGSYGTPTGSVNISDGTGATCTIPSLSYGSGSCNLTSASTGTKTLTASFSGNSAYETSSNTTPHTVNLATSTTTINSHNPDPSLENQSYSVSVTVSGAYSTPGGTVNINDGTGASCTANLSNGSGSCTLISTSIGNKTITATYSGSTAYDTSTTTKTHLVKATSTTTITSHDPEPSFVNQSYLLDVTVSGSYGIPTGTVSINDGSGSSCTANLAAGLGSCNLTSTSIGTKTITATYNGDSTYDSSNKTTSHTVNRAPSTTSISSDNPDPSYVNQGYSVAVAVSSAYGTPTGSVSINDGTGATCTITSLSGGSGSCNLTSASTGTKTITVIYSGSGAYESSSDLASHTVNLTPSTTTINSDNPDPSLENQSFTVSVSVIGVYGTPTGTMNIDDGSGVSCTANLSNGSGSCPLISTTIGSKTITANYSGSGAYDTSSTTTTHLVKATSTTTITSHDPDPSFVNQNYLVAVNVSGSYDTPTGSVSINDGAGASCTITSLSGGSGGKVAGTRSAGQ